MGRSRGRKVDTETRQLCLELIAEAVESGSRIKPACKPLGLTARRVERWRKEPSGDQRKGPKTAPGNKLTEEERNEVIRIATSKEFADKSPAQIVPILADRNQYVASESTFYRILSQEKMNTHRGRAKSPRPRKKPRELIATAPNQVYSWDITYLRATLKGSFYYLYFMVDIFSRKVVGYAVHEEQHSAHAAKLLKKTCANENVNPEELTLHSDNGSPMKGATMLAMLQTLGVAASFSRPSSSNDNPYSEALFKTTKYCPQFPSKPFESLDSALEWVDGFVSWYNTEHRHSGIKFVTPEQRHKKVDQDLLEKRHKLYEKFAKLNPKRWSKGTRNWSYLEKVVLNPLPDNENSGRTDVA